MVCHIAATLAEGIFKNHTEVGNAEVGTIHATLRTVHTATLCAIAVVEHLGRETGEDCTLLSLECKLRHCGAVLTKVDNQRLARIEGYGLARLILAVDNHLAALPLVAVLCILPDITLYRRECKVVTQIYLRAICRQDIARKLAILLRCREQLRGLKAQLLARIILLAIEDCRVLHRTSNARLPTLKVGTIEFCRSISKGQLQYCTKCTLFTKQTVVTRRCDDKICPPTRRNLCRKEVFATCAEVKHLGYIVCKRVASLLAVCKARLEELLAHRLAVYIDLVNTERCCHPLCTDNSLLILECCHKPVGTIGCTLCALLCNYRSIYYRYPLGTLPRRVVECIDPLTNSLNGCRASYNKQQSCRKK